MVPAGISAEQLPVKHMRNPGQRMPIASVSRSESPRDTTACESSFDMRVFCDIVHIVVVDEVVASHLPINSEGGKCQSQINQRNPIFFWRLTHLFKRPFQANYSGFLTWGNKFDLIRFHLASRNFQAVQRHPKPYLMLCQKLIEEASEKYLVGQLTSAIV